MRLRPTAMLHDTVKPALRWAFGQALPKRALGKAADEGDLHGRLVVKAAAMDSAGLRQLFDEVRAAGPLQRSKYAFVTAAQPVCKEVLTSPDFRSGVELDSSGLVQKLFTWSASGAPLGPVTPPSLLVTEPPDHTRYRKLVTRVFTVKAVEELRVRAEEIAHELLDGLADEEDSPIDLIDRYCALLPVTVIAEVLGVPEAERHKVLAFGAAAAPSLDLGLSWRQFREVEQSLYDFETWLDSHLAHLRRNPGDDLMSRLVAAQEDGVGLTDRELKSTAGLVLAAGFETTVNLLGNGIALLCDHPDQLDRLRADTASWSTCVDEVLRLDPPVLLTGRMSVCDTQISGVEIPKGSIVTTLLSAANLDPEVFISPETFDVGRVNARDHVSFSAGRHYCLGASLARMEGEVGLRVLFERYPQLSLGHGARRRETRILRGYERLPAVLGAAAEKQRSA